ncbi:unnamed protein product, partial [Rotaria sordida]
FGNKFNILINIRRSSCPQSSIVKEVISNNLNTGFILFINNAFPLVNRLLLK